MELDRSDNAHTVKRKLQLALNVPTEERSLIFGEKVLKKTTSVQVEMILHFFLPRILCIEAHLHHVSRPLGRIFSRVIGVAQLSY
jgi:hypothetical protein